MLKKVEIELLKIFDDLDLIYDFELNQFFSKEELEIIIGLEEKGYLTRIAQDDEDLDSEKCGYQLSKRGRLLIFKIQNRERIQTFANCLKALRYDSSLLDEYLLTQDLNKPLSLIFNIVSFNAFYLNRRVNESEKSEQVSSSKGSLTMKPKEEIQ